GTQRGRSRTAARRAAPLAGMDRAAFQRQVQLAMRATRPVRAGPYLLLVAFALATPPARSAQPPRAFDVLERTIPELQAAMAAGSVTSRQLVAAYLARIKAYDHDGPSLRAMIAINPRALEAADALDKERAARGPRGPLHGYTVVIKDK